MSGWRWSTVEGLVIFSWCFIGRLGRILNGRDEGPCNSLWCGQRFCGAKVGGDGQRTWGCNEVIAGHQLRCWTSFGG